MTRSRFAPLLAAALLAACSSRTPAVPDVFWQPTQDSRTSRADTWVMRPDGSVVARDEGGGGAAEWQSFPSATTAALHDVWGSGSDDVWAVGDGGVVLHFDGAVWEAMASGVSEGLRTVWGSAPDDVWAAGVDGAMAHWDGSRWQAWTAKPSTTEWLNGLWGSRADEVWVVGGNGVIWRFNGTSWVSASNPEKRSISDVVGFARDDVWAVSGGIFHYDGAKWSYDGSDPMSTLLNGVWGTDAKDLWVVGHFMEIAHYDGASWTIRSASATDAPHLYAIWGSATDNVWAVGHGGKIMRYDGQDWNDWPSPTQSALYGIWGNGADDVWAVGAGGAVLRYH